MGIQGQTKAEKFWGNGTNNAEKVKTTEPSTVAQSPAFKIIAERKHPTLAVRENQIHINLLAQDGGVPYVRARLSRFPGENKGMFKDGLTTKGGQKITSRMDQAHVIPYVTRISEKINQFVFGKPIPREGADEEVLQDISRSGLSINMLMKQASNYLTAARWCWLGVDAPMLPTDRLLSQAEAERLKIRPYWNVYSPLQVIDWVYGPDGSLDWLLSEAEERIGNDPFAISTMRKVRYLWQRGMVTRYLFDEGGMTIKTAQRYPLGFRSVPFVGIGVVSPKPYMMDSIESIMRTIMDLNSCARQNYFESVFPQRFYPASMKRMLKDASESSDAHEQMLAAQGLHAAVFVESGEVPPGVVIPNALVGMEPMRREINSLRDEMYDAVGLMMRSETRSAQSGESKAWDHLDAEQAFKDRAQMLGEAEIKANAISKEIDASWKEWTPKYPSEFNVRDFEKEIETLILMSNVDMPETMRKVVLSKMAEILSSMGWELSEEQRRDMAAAIDAHVITPLVPTLPAMDDEGGNNGT